MKWLVIFCIGMFVTGIFIGYNYPNDMYEKGYQDGYNKYIESFTPAGLFADDVPVKTRNPKLLKKAP